MKAATILLLLITLTGFAQDPIVDRSVSLDEEFTLKNGQQVTIEGQKIDPEIQLTIPRLAVPHERNLRLGRQRSNSS